mgnify:CR=1 FL=1
MLGLNAVLPETVSVIGCCDVPLDFHSRYDCKGKEYIYKIHNSDIRDPFLQRYVCFYPSHLDMERMVKAGRAFEGTHDFAAVRSLGTETKTTVRTVYHCRAEKQGEVITVSVCANGFLYNMVRIMVGTLLDINEGKIEKNTIKNIIESGIRDNAGVTAKAQGLYLNRVYYEDGEICD